MEVASGIYRVEVPLGDRFVCCFVLAGERRTLVVDTGLDATPPVELSTLLADIGGDPAGVDYVLTSHADFDHGGGNGAMRELAPRATFLCHELDRPLVEDAERLISDRYGEFADEHGIDETEEAKAFIRDSARGTPVDLGLRGGERVLLADDWLVDILHTPGHSRGHVSVWDPRSRTAIVCDAVLGTNVPTRDGAPAFAPTYRYVDAYAHTVERLQGLGIRYLLTGHLPVMRDEASAEYLAISRAYVDRVDQALASELRRAGGPLTLRELIDRLSPSLGGWPEAASSSLAYPLLGHLERMVDHGRLRTARHDGQVAYCWEENA